MFSSPFIHTHVQKVQSCQKQSKRITQTIFSMKGQFNASQQKWSMHCVVAAVAKMQFMHKNLNSAFQEMKGFSWRFFGDIGDIQRHLETKGDIWRQRETFGDIQRHWRHWRQIFVLKQTF